MVRQCLQLFIKMLVTSYKDRVEHGFMMVRLTLLIMLRKHLLIMCINGEIKR